MSSPRITIERVALVVVPIATAVVFIAVFAVEKIEIRYDLQLITPPQVSPGGTVPTRAFFFVPSDGIGPADAETRNAVLELVDGAGVVVAEGELMPTLRDVPEVTEDGRFGMDGWLVAPEAAGDYTIHATVYDGDDVTARCDAPLVVTPSPRPSPPQGRPMMPMQQWQLESIQPVQGVMAPSALELRVRGGYCVPDYSCELLVWVGAPAASVRLEGHGATVGDESPSDVTSGIVAHVATVTGPEATVTIIASRDGIEVARRDVRLPIVQSGVPISVGEAICAPPCERTVLGLDDRPVLVDFFRDGVWSRVSTLPPSSEPDRHHTTSLEAGIWAAQLRTDPFGVESAATRLLYVGEEDEAVRAMKQYLVAEEADDAFTRAMPVSGISPNHQVAFGAALLEMDVVALPQARSGRVQADLGLVEDRSALRWVAALAVFAVGLFVAGFVMRRGLLASAEARALLSEAGDEEAMSRKRILSMTLSVSGVVFATILAFVAAALLLLTRGV